MQDLWHLGDGLNCFTAYLITTHFLSWSNPILFNLRPAIQWSFSLWCVRVRPPVCLVQKFYPDDPSQHLKYSFFQFKRFNSFLRMTNDFVFEFSSSNYFSLLVQLLLLTEKSVQSSELWSSVTRWLDYFSIFCHFLLPKNIKFCQSRLILLPNAK